MNKSHTDPERTDLVEAHPPTYGPLFWTGLLVGWAVMGFGAVGISNSVWLKDRPAKLATWVLGGLVVHDALIASLVTGAGLFLAWVLPRWLRGPVAGAAALSGLVVLFSYPLLRGFGRRESNTSILPLDYGRNVAIVLALIWLTAGTVVAVRLVRRGRT